MNGITAWMEKYLVPVAAKIGSQKHLVASNTCWCLGCNGFGYCNNIPISYPTNDVGSNSILKISTRKSLDAC